VTGTASPRIHTRVSAEPLDAAAVRELVTDPRAGAVVVFEGVTRDVERLEYEAYEEMAEPKMREIVAAAAERHGVCAAAVEHRTGEVPLSEPSVVIAVSAPHREAAFAAAREMIDTIKAQLPVWKREEGEGAGGWVPGARPTSGA
jgi:molybdopterin synthase catalytic subunit